jgi:hypothetical protein
VNEAFHSCRFVYHPRLVEEVMTTKKHLASRLTRISKQAPGACRLLALTAALAALAGATGCSPVAPYERGKLAHPTRAAGDMAGFGESHLRAISEGATGGNGGTGSGCGCN